MAWQFAEPENVLVFTSKDVVELGKPIQYVSHDADDGAWQLLTASGAPKPLVVNRFGGRPEYGAGALLRLRA